jgi:hypothetical protein
MRKVAGPKYLLHSEGINVNHFEQSMDDEVYYAEGRAYRALYFILHNQCLQSIHKRLKAPTNSSENSDNLHIISPYSSDSRSVCCRRPWRRFFKCLASLLQRLKRCLLQVLNCTL